MKSQASNQQFLNLYFQVHQPRRLNNFRFFDVGTDHPWFDDGLNSEVTQRIAKACYLPANKMLLELIEKFPSLKITFSLSGTAIEQFEQYAPEVLESFKALARTGQVEFLGETYFHSLSYFISEQEFVEQVRMHRLKLYEVLGVRPAVFRNTELIYSDGIGRAVSDLGFRGIYLDGVDRVFKGKSSNNLFTHPTEPLILFPRNYRLSDDIAFRFADRQWSQWPLTAARYVSWMKAIPENEKFICLGLDYETFGEHKKADTGIFSFFRQFISEIAGDRRIRFVNPSEAIDMGVSREVISTERAVSWADEERDLSAWLGNEMQRDAFDSLYKFHDAIKGSEDSALLSVYRYLQTSDHFYYMSTKRGNDGSVHQYFSPFNSPYEAFMNFMNVVSDLELRVKKLPQQLEFVRTDDDIRKTKDVLVRPW